MGLRLQRRDSTKGVAHIVAVLVATVSFPIAAGAATAGPENPILDVATAPDAASAVSEFPTLNVDEIGPIVVNIVVGVIVAAITHTNTTVRIAKDAIQHVAEVYETACNSNPGFR